MVSAMALLVLTVKNSGGFNGIYLTSPTADLRIFLVLLNFSVGIALLSNISVVPSWNIVETFELEFSGLSPINSSLSTFNSPLDYWAWLYSLLSTPNYVRTVPPTRCSLGLQCQSYYLSGSIYNQIPSASSFVDRPEASFFIVEDSVGYQIDYYPPLLTDNLQGAICATYADSGNWTALQICIKQSGNDLLAGQFFEMVGADRRAFVLL
jgi:hypothetical protein